MALVTFTHAGDVGVVTIDNPPLNLLARWMTTLSELTELTSFVGR